MESGIYISHAYDLPIDEFIEKQNIVTPRIVNDKQKGKSSVTVYSTLALSDFNSNKDLLTYKIKTYEKQIENSYKDPWEYKTLINVEYYNFQIVNGKLYSLDLDDIFNTNLNYVDSLNYYLLNEYKNHSYSYELSTNTMFLDLFLYVKNSYVISREGITFNFTEINAPDRFVESYNSSYNSSNEKVISIFISWDKLKGIMNKQSEFYQIIH